VDMKKLVFYLQIPEVMGGDSQSHIDKYPIRCAIMSSYHYNVNGFSEFSDANCS
jgi:hypothetical protein